MKKAISIFLVLLLCVSFMMVASFAACGNTEGTTEVTPTPTEEVPATPDATEPGLTLEAYIASIQSELDEMIAAMAEQGMNMKVEVRGNSLVYSYQYTEDPADAETMRTALEEATNTQAAMFDSILSELKAAIPSAESIIVEYLSADGTIIYSREFK